MDVLLQDPAPETTGTGSFWKNPRAWLREQNLDRPFWVFFTAAFFFDAGFAVYFFLFNLYLLDIGFNERAIGLVGGAFTFGSILGTLPAGLVARKIGVRRLLIVCFVAAPLVNILRTIWTGEARQIGFAFLSGMAMCTWGVCFLPVVARLTTGRNRASAFGLIFSVSIGTSALGAAVSGYLPQWLRTAGFAMQAAEVKSLILRVACGIALVGLIAVLRLRIPPETAAESPVEVQPPVRNWLRAWKLNPFLVRFLPLMALWSAVLAAFTPFSNVYLVRALHIPFAQVGLIFSSAQLVQLCFGLLTPLVFRLLGLVNGIVATQIAAAVALASLAGVRDERLAVAFYMTFYAAQWMCSPGLYNLLMTETPDKERSTAAAMALFCNALAGTAATTCAGVLFTRFGYPLTLLGIALVALASAILFRILIAPQSLSAAGQP